MNEKLKAGPVERWNRAMKEAEPEARDVLEASDEEIERELREAGVDLDEEDKKATATYAAVVAKHFPQVSPAAHPEGEDEPRAWVAPAAQTEGGASVTKLDDRRSRSSWVAWGLVAAAAVGGSVYVAAHPPAPPPPPPPPDLPKPNVPVVTPAPAPAPAPVTPPKGKVPGDIK